MAECPGGIAEERAVGRVDLLGVEADVVRQAALRVEQRREDGAPSTRGRHSQSIAPSSATSATVRRSPVTA